MTDDNHDVASKFQAACSEMHAAADKLRRMPKRLIDDAALAPLMEANEKVRTLLFMLGHRVNVHTDRE